MKYTLSIDLALPRERVIELFDNPDNLAKWQPGLKSYEHLKGKPGQPGARARMTYEMGKRTIEMIETVTERNLPDTFSGTYETPIAFNRLYNQFEEVDPGTTRWTVTSDFAFSSIGMKLMGVFMKGAFVKQTQSFLDRFKAFAEQHSE